MHSQISPMLMKFTLILITYSFGTFGLLNLFGLRLSIQVFIICLAIGILSNLKISSITKEIIYVVVFAIFLVFGGIVNGGYIEKLGDALLMIIIIILIMGSPDRHVLGLAKVLVVCTAFLISLVLIALIGYGLYPDQIQYANFEIYDSTTGHKKVLPGSAFDWFSFTSGDGFEIAGRIYTRLKGYSNEPSSTIVHYLVPAAFAFFLGGRYIYLGFFILIVNVLAITSLVSILVILCSLIAMTLMHFFKKQFLHLSVICLALIFILIVQPDVVVNIFSAISAFFVDNFEIDLLSRKIANGADDASIRLRLNGIVDGINLVLLSPIGYSYELLGAGAGLIYIVSANSGWIGTAIFFLFIVRFGKKVLRGAFVAETYINRYALALTMSLIIVALLISGYGWDRPPGMIMIFLLYRMTDIQIKKVFC
jgi:hypothetical protein